MAARGSPRRRAWHQMMCPFFGCGARIGTVSAPGAGSGPARLAAVRPRRRSPPLVVACGGELHESSRRPHAVDATPTHGLSSPCAAHWENARSAREVAQAVLYVLRHRSGEPQRRGQPDWPPGSPRVAQRPRGNPSRMTRVNSCSGGGRTTRVFELARVKWRFLAF